MVFINLVDQVLPFFGEYRNHFLFGNLRKVVCYPLCERYPTYRRSDDHFNAIVSKLFCQHSAQVRNFRCVWIYSIFVDVRTRMFPAWEPGMRVFDPPAGTPEDCKSFVRMIGHGCLRSGFSQDQSPPFLTHLPIKKKRRFCLRQKRQKTVCQLCRGSHLVNNDLSSRDRIGMIDDLTTDDYMACSTPDRFCG